MSEYKDRKAIEHFEEFLKTFVVGKKSYISEKEEVIVPENVESTYKSYCGISIKDGKDRIFSEIEKDIKENRGIDLEILNHAIFLWGLPIKDKPALVLTDRKYKVMPTCPVGGAGQEYKNKLKRVRFILYIFTEVFKLDKVDKIKERIEEICKNKTYNILNDNKQTDEIPSDLKNFLLYFCNSEKYAPIGTDGDKEKIVNAFGEGIDGKDIDSKIANIRKEIFNKDTANNKIKIIQAITDKENNYPFYDENIKWLWRGESDGDNLSRVKLLEYKKAMVLYGPPGTGKTYTAMELAKEMLVRYWVKQYENSNTQNVCIEKIKKITEIKDLIEENKKEEKNIYYLQLHVNYSYENFIAGQVIEGNNIVTKQGFIYDVIEKANNKKQEPFVVILDEMNRVDVSRVFGELFTAIEKRNTPVDLTLPDPQNPGKRLTLTIPENIYFIGTMNEIDFSLEQLDFALRRRFIWELADYNSDSLEQIITSRLSDDLSKKKDLLNNNIVNISNFIECCDNLNKTIEGHNSLGEKYHIGHAFFAEVAEIIKKHPTNDFKKSKSILWQISILPTLEAYCGTMDSSDKKTFIEKCKASYEGKSE